MKRGVIRNAVGKFVKVPVDPNVTTRICWCCQQEKDLSLFGNDKTGLLGKKGKCKKCESDATNRYNKRNPDKIRKVGRRLGLRKYGLTIEAYEALFESQGRACALCRTTKTGGGAGRFRWITTIRPMRSAESFAQTSIFSWVTPMMTSLS
jgi:hypothetical protein